MRIIVKNKHINGPEINLECVIITTNGVPGKLYILHLSNFP